ncbi:hypothetical protein OG607_27825 [Streptomyces sp. NBC_01537]|uniref:hypothetical protein n=1 Tax=Streptomyces sp. NBC_01537 TaxID=2903896 RepID=UPI003866F77E
MAKVIDSLNESESDLVGRLATARFARLALLDVSEWWVSAMSPGFRTALEEASRWDAAAPTARDVASLASFVDESLDLLDETPTGELYYPYQATCMLETCCWGFGEGRGRKFLARLWEDSQRYMGHVDWQLGKSRILSEESNRFQKLDEKLWLRHARLSGTEDDEYESFVRVSTEVGDECIDALRCALSEEATADFVIILDESVKENFDGLVERGAHGARLKFGDPIYTRRMNDANLDFFDNPAFLYVWGLDGAAVAGLLRSADTERVLVDSRRPDGMVVDGAGFIANPVESTRSW